MWIMVVYVLIVLVSESAVVAIGLVLDRIYPAFSLTVSLLFFFAVLWFVELEKKDEQLKPYIKRKVEQYREAWDQEYSAIFSAQQA